MMWKLCYGDRYFEQVIKKDIVTELDQSFETQLEHETETEEMRFGII
jgi:hypothetical protein